MSKNPETKIKKLYYKRACWQGQKEGETLEKLIKTCHKKYQATSET